MLQMPRRAINSYEKYIKNYDNYPASSSSPAAVEKKSPSIMLRIVAIGTASIMPGIPANRPPNSTAMMVTSGFKPTALRIIFGTSTCPSTCWTTKYITNAIIPNSTDCESARITPNSADKIGPTTGKTSKIPATTPSANAYLNPILQKIIPVAEPKIG